MSETTLTTDVLDQLRASIVAVYASAEASFAAYREAQLPVPREVVKLLEMKAESCWVPQAMFDQLTAERDALAAQLTEVTRERDGLLDLNRTHVGIIAGAVKEIDSAKAALAPLRAVVEAAKAFMLKWPDAEKAINGAIVIATVHSCPYVGPSLEDELYALRRALSALPADPSAPTLVSVTREQAEQRLRAYEHTLYSNDSIAHAIPDILAALFPLPPS